MPEPRERMPVIRSLEKRDHCRPLYLRGFRGVPPVRPHPALSDVNELSHARDVLGEYAGVPSGLIETTTQRVQRPGTDRRAGRRISSGEMRASRAAMPVVAAGISPARQLPSPSMNGMTGWSDATRQDRRQGL